MFSFPLQRPNSLSESPYAPVLFDFSVQEMASVQLAAWELALLKIRYSPLYSPLRVLNFSARFSLFLSFLNSITKIECIANYLKSTVNTEVRRCSCSIPSNGNTQVFQVSCVFKVYFLCWLSRYHLSCKMLLMLAGLVPHHELVTFDTLLKPKPLESHE